MYIAILGTHPALSRAELECNQEEMITYTDKVAIFKGAPSPHLGGASKIAEVIEVLDTTDKDQITNYLGDSLLDTLDLPAKKLSLGISIYGPRIDTYKQTVFELKKRARKSPYHIKPRIVLGKGQALSSAQVLHNHLQQPDKGCEIIVACSKDATYIGRTVWIQDIASYSKRDMERPVRDMDVGMLPPKLAQIMVNLSPGSHIYDPFCGTGVVLQEALLMGKDASGSDISSEMVEATQKNLAWMSDNFNTASPSSLQVADARDVAIPPNTDAIVTEGYLGPIQHGKASKEELEKLARESGALMKETLQNLYRQLPAGAHLCIALPAWSFKKEIILPPLVDTIEQLGYNRVRLNSATDKELLYMRSSQYVGRQLILLEKK